MARLVVGWTRLVAVLTLAIFAQSLRVSSAAWADLTPGNAVVVPGTRVLTGIACPSSTTCFAVGYVEEQNPFSSKAVVVPIVDGRPDIPIVVPGQISFFGIACANTTTCYAVGKGLVPIVNGTVQTDNILTMPDGSGFSHIACSSSMCYGLGATAPPSPYSMVVPITDGTLGIPVVSSRYFSFKGFACADSSTCYAVGSSCTRSLCSSYDEGFVVPIVDGTLGSYIRVPDTIALDGITCPSGSTCYAVGSAVCRGDSCTGHIDDAVVVKIDGSPGTPIVMPGSWHAFRIACGSSTTCYALGWGVPSDPAVVSDAVVVPLLDGSPGTPIVVPSLKQLQGIACASSTACYAVGARKEEPLPPNIIRLGGSLPPTEGPTEGMVVPIVP